MFLGEDVVHVFELVVALCLLCEHGFVIATHFCLQFGMPGLAA